MSTRSDVTEVLFLLSEDESSDIGGVLLRQGVVVATADRYRDLQGQPRASVVTWARTHGLRCVEQEALEKSLGELYRGTDQLASEYRQRHGGVPEEKVWLMP